MLTLLSTDIPWGSIEQLLWCRKGDTRYLNVTSRLLHEVIINILCNVTKTCVAFYILKRQITLLMQKEHFITEQQNEKN
jgi:hypothetical protein